MLPRAPLAGTCVWVSLLLWGCSEASSPAPAPAAPPPRAGRLDAPVPIVLITIDTLRRDHLGCYGYFRDTSPNLDAFAAEGVLFERAVSAMATTLPSHLSLLTGLYPHQHGIEANRSGAQGPFEPGPGRTSAAVLLRAAGYRTAAFTSAAPVCRATGVLVGFDHLDDVSPGVRPAAETARNAVRWMERTAGAPFFVWIHLWDPHEPNRPAARFTKTLGDGARIDDLLRERGVDAARISRECSDHVLARLVFPDAPEGAPLPAVDDDALRRMVERYDGDVRAADEAAGLVFAELRSLGLWNRAIVVVAGDHGQSLGQHGWLDHGAITNENVLVPLLARFPPGVLDQPLRVATTVSLVDVMPTVLARLSAPVLDELARQAEGRDVFAGDFARDYAFVERTTSHRKGWIPGREFALLGPRWKYLFHESGPDALYDLAADPLETRDVLARHPELAAELGARARTLAARRPAPGRDPDRVADPELLEALEGLGYTEEE